MPKAKYIVAFEPSLPIDTRFRLSFTNSSYQDLEALDDITAIELFRKLQESDEGNKRGNPDLYRHASLYKKLVD